MLEPSAKIALAIISGLFLLANSAGSQTFDSFQFVGLPAAPSGTVTGLQLSPPGDGSGPGPGQPDINATSNAGEVSFFDAAGSTSVFHLAVRSSSVISQQTKVRRTADGSADQQLSDLHTISFYTGELTHESKQAPANWFRLTYFEGVWSGVFRVGNQIYAIDRERSSNVVRVRNTPSDANFFIPTLRARISAVFDLDYFSNGTPDSHRSQVLALESIHVLDGLLSDSLGVTLLLEHISLDNIFNAAAFSNDTMKTAAGDWRQRHQDAYGLNRHLATLFFIDEPNPAINVNSTTNAATNSTSNPAIIASEDKLIVQDLTPEYQFATAHSFGALLNLQDQAGTLQDWQTNGLVSLPAVHWSSQQRNDFDAQTSASPLLQVLSNDQPAEDAPMPEPDALPDTLVDSDTEEREAPRLQNDTNTNGAALTAAQSSGGGTAVWVLLVGLVLLRQLVCPALLKR